MNPKVNGQLQREWSWLIAIYLFLGGIGGGAYTIAAGWAILLSFSESQFQSRAPLQNRLVQTGKICDEVGLTADSNQNPVIQLRTRVPHPDQIRKLQCH